MAQIKTCQSEVELSKEFITGTITRGFNEAKEGRFAGKNLTSLDALVKELKAEA